MTIRMMNGLIFIFVLPRMLCVNDKWGFQRSLFNNPLARTIKNTYDFFYWYPRRNLPYDSPVVLFKNNTAQFIAWYQFPHNLPPYRYVGTEEFGYPADFFCYGLPGNTLPLGDWDPCGFQLVSKKVVRKYRESELKHGRISMVAITGFLVQESFHPLHPEIGGLAITHMDKLVTYVSDLSIFFPLKVEMPIEFSLVLMTLMSAEIYALLRNWSRWKRNEYNHQFDHNIGVGNLKENYNNGDYGVDFLRLLPSVSSDPEGHRDMLEKELNNGRLAMIAIVGVIAQEYLTGIPAMKALFDWLLVTNTY